MPLEIKVVEDSFFNEEDGYLVLRNDYCFEEGNNLDKRYCVFTVLNSKTHYEVLESYDLNELAEKIKDCGIENLYTFPENFLYNENPCEDDDAGVNVIKTFGLRNSEKDKLVEIANKEYEAIMSRQLSLGF